MVYDLTLSYALEVTSVQDVDTTAPSDNNRRDEESLVGDNGACAGKAVAVSWQERVALVYGGMWSHRCDDTSASRGVTAWFLLTVASVRIMAAFHPPLLPAALQTYVMQVTWLGVESYCGILRPYAALACAAPYVAFVLLIGLLHAFA